MVDELSKSLLLRIRIATQDAKKAQQEITSIKKDLESYYTTERKIAQGGIANANVTTQQAKGFQALSRNLKDVKKDFDEVGKSAAQAATLVDRVKPEVEAFRREGEIQGFAKQSLRTAALGGGGALGASAVQIFDIVDSLPKIPLALTIVRDSLVSNVQAIGKGLSAIGPAGLAAGAALAVLGVAFASFISEQQKRAEDLGNFIRRQQEIELDIAVGGKTREQLQAELERAETEYQVKQRQFLASVDAYNDNLERARQATGVLSGLGEIVARAVDPLEDELAKIVEENRVAAVAAADNIALLNQFLNENATSTNDAAEAAKKAAEEEQKRLSVNEQALTRLTALQDQATAAIDRYNESLRETAEGRQIRDTRAGEDEQERREKSALNHQKSLTKIAEDGQARIKSINEQIANIVADSQADIVAARLKGQQAEQSLTASYFEDNQKQLEKFRAEELKRTQSANKQRLRDLQDLQDRLNDAARANDVVAFLQAQREGEKRIQRTSEDVDEETTLRSEAFAKESAERRAGFEQRLAELRRSTEEEISQIQTAANERRTALAASLEEEKAAIRERLRAQVEAFAASEAEQEAARQKRLRRQREDDERADRRQAEQLKRQLMDIDAKGQAEVRAIGAAVGATNELLRVALQLGEITRNIRPVSPTAPTAPTSPKPSGLGGSGSFFDRLFGGRSQSGTPSIGVPQIAAAGAGAAPQVNVIMNNSIGDIATVKQVEQGLQVFGQQLQTGLQGMFSRMLN